MARPAVAISSTRPQTTTITSPSLRGMLNATPPDQPGCSCNPWNPGPIKTGAPYMSLWVADGNDTAGTLHQHVDFVLTGEWAPMPHDAATGEQRMRQVLSPATEQWSAERDQP